MEALDQGLLYVIEHPKVKDNGFISMRHKLEGGLQSNLHLQETFYPMLGKALCALGRFQQALKVHKDGLDCFRRLMWNEGREQLRQLTAQEQAASLDRGVKNTDCHPDNAWVAQALMATGRSEEAILVAFNSLALTSQP